MNIWLVTVGEPLPLPGEEARLWRCGLLARTLVSRGHQVTWWTSTFDHINKQYFNGARPGEEADVLGGVCLRWLHGIRYRRNLSIGRLVNHAQLAVHFARLARKQPRPQVIVVSLPTIELGFVAARLARRWQIPLIVDVRDLWPDIFLDPVPRLLRGPAAVVLAPYFLMTRSLMRRAASVVAVSQRYLDWGLRVAARSVRPGDAVFPLGYEPSEADEQDHQVVARLLQLRDDQLVVVFAGSFGRTYDLATVIEAARILHASGCTRLHFVLCGTGERQGELLQLAGSLPNVVFTGLLSARKLAAVLGRAAIGLAAYAVDAPQGIPNKIVEYSCAGLAIVSSLSGEAQALIAGSACGLSYVAGDPDGLASHLRDLTSDAVGLERMRSNALGLYRSRFCATDVYEAMANHVESVGRGSMCSLRMGMA